MNNDKKNKALEHLVAAIYIDSDYEQACRDAVREIDPDIHAMLEENPARAYLEVQGRVS